MKTLTVTKAIISDSKVIFKMSSNNTNNNINNKTNNNMNNTNNKTKNVSLTLKEAKELYNSNNDILKELALKVFNEKELTEITRSSFKDIKSFKDACEAVYLDYDEMIKMTKNINEVSTSSAAMFKLNIIKAALNLGQDLHFTKDSDYSSIYYPCNPFMAKGSISYNKTYNLGNFEIIGRFKYKEKTYLVSNAEPCCACYAGLSNFQSNYKLGNAYYGTAFLGCATIDIAEHFGKYFGMLITEAKYGDLYDFNIIKSKYKI